MRTRLLLLSGFIVLLALDLGQAQLQWKVPITVSDGINTKALRFGIDPSGTDGFDLGLDTLAPPAPPAGAFDARFRVASPANDFFTDIRSNVQQVKTFTMLYAPVTGQPSVTITWNPAVLSTLCTAATITDNITGTLYTQDMFTTSSANSSNPLIQSSLRIVITNPLLPIQLASFTGTVTTTGTVLLEWVTISEINNYGFEIQRHGVGEPFASLPGVFIPGHGTTLEPHYYSYTDATVVPRQWWYRLKQIDYDGSFSYSPEVMVNTLTNVGSGEQPTQFALDQNYPNPFNPGTTIKYSIGNSCRVVLKLYDVFGQQLATLVDQVQESGVHFVDLDGRNLPSGVYYYAMEAGAFGEVKKLVLLK